MRKVEQKACDGEEETKIGCQHFKGHPFPSQLRGRNEIMIFPASKYEKKFVLTFQSMLTLQSEIRKNGFSLSINTLLHVLKFKQM